MKKVLLILMFGCILVYAATAASYESGFSVERLVVGSDVVDREPVGVSDTFPASQEMVYCYLEAKYITEDTTVSFVWFYEDEEVARVTLSLGEGPRWRTWSSKKIAGRTGQWKVELRDLAGTPVESVTFTVQ